MSKYDMNIFLFRKHKMNLPLLYLHRFIRLTPLFGVSFLFSMSLLRFFGSGPFWNTMLHFFNGECERYWWAALLYIQNFVNQNDIVSIFLNLIKWQQRYILHSFIKIRLFKLIRCVSVFSTFLVFVTWHAALFACTGHFLFDVSIQGKSTLYIIRISFGMHRMHIGCAFEI